MIPGEYRIYANYCFTQNGPHVYLHQEALDDSMTVFSRKMSEFFNSGPEEFYRHPLVTGTLLQYNFVALHPFVDGNGCIGRLLMNTVLLRHGYQPAVIRAKSKREYFDSLAFADETKDLVPLIQLSLHEAIDFHEFVATLPADCLKALAGQKQPEVIQ